MPRQPVAHGRQRAGHAAQVLVVGVQKDEAAGLVAQVVVEFTLGAHHALKRAEAFEVSHAHVGDEAALGLHEVGEQGNFARVVSTRLNHRHLVVRAQLQQRFGHTNVVVEVALRAQQVELAGQHGRGEFLGGRLAVGARYLHDGRAQGASVQRRELLQRSEHVGHVQQPFVAPDGGVVYHGKGATRLQGLQGKGVAVEALPAQGEEEGALGAVTRVGGDDAMRLEQAVKLLERSIGYL